MKKILLIFLIIFPMNIHADELVFEEIKEKIPEEYCLKVLNIDTVFFNASICIDVIFNCSRANSLPTMTFIFLSHREI